MHHGDRSWKGKNSSKRSLLHVFSHSGTMIGLPRPETIASNLSLLGELITICYVAQCAAI